MNLWRRRIFGVDGAIIRMSLNLNLWNDLWGSANFFRGIILFVRILG